MSKKKKNEVNSCHKVDCETVGANKRVGLKMTEGCDGRR